MEYRRQRSSHVVIVNEKPSHLDSSSSSTGCVRSASRSSSLDRLNVNRFLYGRELLFPGPMTVDRWTNHALSDESSCQVRQPYMDRTIYLSVDTVTQLCVLLASENTFFAKY